MSTATPSTHMSAAEPDAAAAAETIAAAESEIAATAQAIAALRKKLKTLRARRTGREGEGALEEQLRAQLKRRARQFLLSFPLSVKCCQHFPNSFANCRQIMSGKG